MSPCACQQSDPAWSARRVRGLGALAWKRSVLPPTTALMLHLSRFTAHARCLPPGVVQSDVGIHSSTFGSFAPQDLPLRTDEPTGKMANYPFKLHALTIAIIASVVAVNAAFVACCLHIIWTRLCSPTRGDSPASAIPPAADEPQPGVAGGGPDTDDSARRAHIGMTAVVQPNDEVAIAVRVLPEAHPCQVPDRQEGIHAAARLSADSASSVHTSTGMFKNPAYLVHEHPGRHNMLCGSAICMF